MVKGKRKLSYPSSSDSALLDEMQDELKEARAKLEEHDRENARRDAELKEAKTELAGYRIMFSFLKEKNSDFLDYVNQAQLATTAPATSDPPSPATSEPPSTQS